MPGVKLDGSMYCDHVLLHKDNALVTSMNVDSVLRKEIVKQIEIKEESIRILEACLGGTSKR